jgi:hypothetical protein
MKNDWEATEHSLQVLVRLINQFNSLSSPLQHASMHILKIKGKAKIPDYIQIRDDDFTLKAYFRVDRPDKSLEKMGLGNRMEELLKLIEEMPFGKVIKID